MEKYHILTLLIFFNTSVFSQLGIGTTTPEGVVHIVNNDQNIQENNFIITNTGSVGIGNKNPKTKLDIRSINQNSAIGLGTSNQIASEAGEGAIRYKGSVGSGNIEYSNGTDWIPISITLPNKDRVMYIKTTNKVFLASQENIIDNWDVLAINSKGYSSNFNPSTGIYTAPRDGYYIFNAAFNFTSMSISGNRIISLNLNHTRGATTIDKFVCSNGYLTPTATGTGVVANTEVGESCAASFKLKQGDKLSVSIDNQLGNSGNLRVATSGQSSGFVHLTINEN